MRNFFSQISNTKTDKAARRFSERAAVPNMRLRKSKSAQSQMFAHLCSMAAVSALNCSIKDQKTVLSTFYASSGGGEWFSSSGWNSTDVNTCLWQGIGCSDEGLVTSIYLPFNNVGTCISLSESCDLLTLTMHFPS